MPECAFCPKTAKLTGEHLWSGWMRQLFSSKEFRFIKRDLEGNISRVWRNGGIDLTAHVVCKTCNEGWMSHLESHHAKKALTDFIIGGKDFVVSHVQAQAIARFAFKTAVVVDHMKRDGNLFFPSAARHHFAKSLKIPSNVQIWFAGYLPMGSGNLFPCWYENRFPDGHYLKLYVCTYAVGHFVFQLVAAEVKGIIELIPHESFENLSIPLWPNMPHGVQWPPVIDVLRTKRDFVQFAGRWRKIKKIGLAHMDSLSDKSC
jgi:hypothetical protein